MSLLSDSPFGDLIGRCADPAAVRARLSRLLDARAAPATLQQPPEFLRAVCLLFDSGPWLSELLLGLDPAGLDWLRREVRQPQPRATERLAGDLAAFLETHGLIAFEDALGRFKNRQVLRIAALDLLGRMDLAQATLEISNLADAILGAAVRRAGEALCARHGTPQFRLPSGSLEPAAFAVMALGKLGGRELNYSSDIDLLFLYTREGVTAGLPGRSSSTAVSNREYFTKLARALVRMLTTRAAGGVIYRVDLRLRPGGRQGELVNSLAAADAYYRHWADPVETLALIKARPAAGDHALGTRFLREVRDAVFPEAPDPDAAAAFRRSKDVINKRLLRAGESTSNIKLGRGGIREIEFLVQAHQVLFGGGDPWLRQAGTLMALYRLADRRHLTIPEYAALAGAYEFLRATEHRLQLAENRQTHLLPRATDALQRLAHGMGYREAAGRDAGSRFMEELDHHRSAVRALYDNTFFHFSQPMLPGMPGMEAGPARSGPEFTGDEWRRRFAAWRVENPERAVATFAGLQQRLARLSGRAGQGLPAARLLDELADAFDVTSPDAAARSVDNLQRLLSALPDVQLAELAAGRHPPLQPLVHLLGRSRYLTDILIHHPRFLSALGTECAGRPQPIAPPEPAVRWSDETLPGKAAGMATLRRERFKYILTCGFQEILLDPGLDTITGSLSGLAELLIAAALQLAVREIDSRSSGGDPPGSPLPIAILGAGKLGCRELDYESDLDLILLYDEPRPSPERHGWYQRLGQALVRILSSITADGPLYAVDCRLRPGGRDGELVPSAGAFRRYLADDADVWERQALLKARPVAGDRALGEQITAMIAGAVLSRPAVRMRERTVALRRERLGTLGRARDIKHGRGGLLDITIAMQDLQIARGIAAPAGSSTRAVLRLLRDGGALTDDAAGVLSESHFFLRNIEHQIRLTVNLTARQFFQRADPRREAALAAVLLDPLEDEDAGHAAARLRARIETALLWSAEIVDDLLGTVSEP